MVNNKTSSSKASAWSFVLFTVLPLFSTSILSYFLLKNQSFVDNLSFFQWLIITLVLTIMSAFAMAPPTFLAVIMGYFIGFWSLPFLLFINFGAIFIIYLIYKNLDFNWAHNYLNNQPKAKKLLNNIRAQEFKFVFFAKLSPVLPFALTNLTFAVSGARLKNIIFGGFLGMLPRTIFAVYTGSQAKEIISLIDNPQSGLWQKLMVLLLIISFWGMLRIIKFKEL